MVPRLALAAALLFICSGCGSSSPSSPSNNPPTSGGGGGTGTPVSIVSGASGMTSTAYAPNPVTISAGGSVTWTNNDNTTHTATGASISSGSIAPGRTFTMTFPSAGSFTYHCTIHPGMTGTVTVQ